MRTLTAALLTAQTSGYPVGSYAPAVRCIFTSKDGGTTHDYSFDPTVTTNRLEHVQQIEERENDSGIILLSNYDRAVPTDLTGYYVDLGWGLNTSSGILWDTAAGAVAPRMWIMRQSDISGAPKGSLPQLYTLFQLQGVWGAVLNKQPFLVESTPFSDIPLYKYDELNTISALTGKTIYGVLEYIIEVLLFAQTGLAFTLDDLGAQDDGEISSIIPFPSDNTKLLRTINDGSPWYFETYGDVIRSLLELTNCILVPRADLAFRIMYPQSSDTADVTYYSSNADGHPFYEAENRRLNMIPNHIEVYGGEDAITGYPTVTGHWYDTDHFSGWVSPATLATYDGPFMEVKASGSTDRMLWETGLDTAEKCRNKAAELGWQLKDQIRGTRVIIPMDARVELYDRVEVNDARGL
ncbi:hypothetical protein LCGC14_0477280 [marine sediment metagenome]|uniref:Uncharacterized protein n=1 Tax=marine sediment metagenome TaxID=412755 RepID=A0A0F9UXJ6_9ZZZZ